MAPSNIHLVNDTIVSAHRILVLSPRETHVRDAMFLITVFAPLVAAAFSLLATEKWYLPKRAFSYGVLSAVWFTTVSAFGTLVFFQNGETSRLTFMLAVVHGQVEVLIWTLLLAVGVTRSLLLSWLWGMVMYLLVLMAPDPATIFIFASIIAGANDFIIAALLAYAKSWTLAFGAFGHLTSAVVVFTNFITFIPVVKYNALIFITLWLHIGPTVGGLILLRKKEGDSPNNPIFGTKVPMSTFWKIVGISLVGSTAITLLLAYVAPS